MKRISLVVAALAVLVGLWGSASWYALFPPGSAAGMVDAVFLFALSCGVYFFHVGTLPAARRWLFCAAFLSVVAFSALTLAGPAKTARGAVLAACLGSDAVVFAVAGLWRRRACQSRVATRVDAVSARECAIAALVAAGRTNAEIAAELFISLPTVKTHLAHLFEKTGSRNRVEVARWYATLDAKIILSDDGARHAL